ncbi:Hypothetical protein ADP8_05222 (plasmid) [Roseomonas mucosa]|nr:Hypothetical protein ADP8_05222 [Roseomonas mucosa]
MSATCPCRSHILGVLRSEPRRRPLLPPLSPKPGNAPPARHARSGAGAAPCAGRCPAAAQPQPPPSHASGVGPPATAPLFDRTRGYATGTGRKPLRGERMKRI